MKTNVQNKSPANHFSERASDLRAFVASEVTKLRNGDICDFDGTLKAKPELLDNHSLLFDLVIEDFHSRKERGFVLGPLTYRELFESIDAPLASSIERLIAIEQALETDTSAPRLVWPVPGDEVGHFRVVEELGRGSFSRVYHCLEQGLGNRNVVVKVSRKKTLEAEQLGKLDHPTIVPIHSISYDERFDTNLIAMPLLGTHTFADLVALTQSVPHQEKWAIVSRWILQSRKPESNSSHNHSIVKDSTNYEEFLLQLFANVCDGLSHAHSQDVVHSDVKPSNILLTNDGMPLLIDFNLSCPALSLDGVIGGTREYMAPELWDRLRQSSQDDRVDALLISGKCDVFSVVVTLAECVAGRQPFVPTGDSSQDIATSTHANQKKSLQHAIGRLHLSHRLSKVLTSCLEVDPQLRPTATDLRDALNLELETKRKVTISKKLNRRRAIQVASAFAVATLGGSFFLLGRENRQYQSAVRDFEDKLYAEASRKLSRLIKDNPTFLKAIYLRSWCNLKTDQYDLAVQELSSLQDQLNSPHLSTYLAYAYARQRRHEVAIYWYERADKASFPWQCSDANNYGCSYWRGKKSNDPVLNWELIRCRAATWFSEASILEPKAKAPRLNLVRFLAEAYSYDKSLCDHAVPNDTKNAQLTAEKLMIFDASAEAALASATLLANVEGSTPKMYQQACHLFKRAVRNGTEPSRKEWESNPVYQPFHRSDEIRGLSKWFSDSGLSVEPVLMEPTMVPYDEIPA